MRFFAYFLLFSLLFCPVAYSQVVQEGTNGHWFDTPEGPDVSPNMFYQKNSLWIPNPVSMRVSDKDVVFMGSFARQEFVSQPLVKKTKTKASRLASVKNSKIRNGSPLKAGSKNITREQQSLIHFFENWGNACPGDRSKPVAPKNRVKAVPFQNLAKFFKKQNPDVLVFQYENSPKVFNQDVWKSFITQVPKKRGCFVIAPQAKPGRLQQNRDYSLALESFFKHSNHHCQVIHRVAGQGSEDVIQSICDRDYRSTQKKSANNH